MPDFDEFSTVVQPSGQVQGTIFFDEDAPSRQQANAGGRGNREVVPDFDSFSTVVEKAPATAGAAGGPDKAAGFGEGLVDSITQGLTFNFGDELTALENALLGRPAGGDTFDLFNFGDSTFSERFNESLDAERTQQEQFGEQHTVADIAGEVAGAVATGVGAVRAIPALAGAGRSLVGRAAIGTGEGAAAGALFGAGGGEGAEDRAQGALQGAGIGAFFGGLFPVAANLVSRARGARDFVSSSPSVEQLRAQSRALFQRVEANGAHIAADSFDGMVAQLGQDLINEGIDVSLHPRAVGVFRRLLANEDDLTFRNIQTLRRVLRSAANSPDQDEVRLANIMIDRLDEFVENLRPSDFVSGAAGTAAKDLAQAREIWGRMRRTQILDEIFERAQRQASGFENGLRIEFRKLLNNKNLSRGFTEQERAIMQRVVNGTLAGNTLRRIGRFSFGIGAESNALGGAIGAGAGAAVGGPLGAAAVPLVAAGARGTAQRMTRNNAELARAMVASGQSPQVQRSTLSQFAQEVLAAPGVTVPGQGGASVSELLRGQ